MKLRDLFPKQFDFFAMLNALAQKVESSVSIFFELLEHPANGEMYSRKIHQLEAEADKIVHQTIDKLHETFITPMDRENIHSLLLKVDDTIDLILTASQRVYLYRVHDIPEDIEALGKLSLDSVKKCCQLIYALNQFKQPEELKRICIEINQLENKTDDKMQDAMVNLFANESDFKNFIKKKELIEIFEDLADTSESIAHLVEAIILEHA